MTITHYDALTEPIIEPVGAEESVRVDKFQLPPARPVQRPEFYLRAHLNDIQVFDDLFRTPLIDDWEGSDTRPIQRVPFYIRQHLNDIQLFDDLFAELRARPLMWRGFFRR